MRSSSAPLLSVSKGRGPAGSPDPRGLSITIVKRLVSAAVIALAVLGLATLLRPGGDGSGGKGGSAASLVWHYFDLTAFWGCQHLHSFMPWLRLLDAGSGTAPWTVSGLEAAVQAQHGAGSEEGGQADADSLAAVQKRFEKAVALPPPEFRSHASGMTLSPGAAAAAAACSGAACDLVRRFVLAAQEAAALSDTGGCAVQHCPDALGIGLRPLPYTAFAFGNCCEPFYNRGALEVVRQLVDGAGMRGLEWFTGSSTSWFLARLAHLTSVETAKGGWVRGPWLLCSGLADCWQWGCWCEGGTMVRAWEQAPV